LAHRARRRAVAGEQRLRLRLPTAAQAAPYETEPREAAQGVLDLDGSHLQRTGQRARGRLDGASAEQLDDGQADPAAEHGERVVVEAARAGRLARSQTRRRGRANRGALRVLARHEVAKDLALVLVEAERARHP